MRHACFNTRRVFNLNSICITLINDSSTISAISRNRIVYDNAEGDGNPVIFRREGNARTENSKIRARTRL